MPSRSQLNETFADEDFLTLSKTAKKPAESRRFLGLHHIQQGKTQLAVAAMLCVRQPTIQGWIKRYRNHGIKGVYDQPGQGRKSKLSPQDALDFKAEFLALQAANTGGSLTVYDAIKILQDKFQPLRRTAAYRLMHGVGLSWISGRDAHPKRNLDAQTDFKKNLG